MEQLAIAPARVQEKAEGELSITLREMLDLLARCEASEDSDESSLLNDEIAGSVSQSISQKLRGYQKFFSFCDAQAEECGEEIARLQARKKALDNAKQRLRRYLAAAMDAYQIKRLDAGTVVFTLVGGRTSLEITDADKLPGAYLEERIVVDIDKAALKVALERGETIEGAQLVTGEPFIVVK